MKKKILIGVLVVIIIAVVATCYFVFNDGKQEQKLKDELLEISNLTNVTPIDVDARIISCISNSALIPKEKSI